LHWGHAAEILVTHHLSWLTNLWAWTTKLLSHRRLEIVELLLLRWLLESTLAKVLLLIVSIISLVLHLLLEILVVLLINLIFVLLVEGLTKIVWVEIIVCEHFTFQATSII